MREMKYEIKDEEIQSTMKALGNMIGSQMPPGYGFNLLIFSYGEGGNMFYISSAQRQDMINAMREFIDKFEVRQ